AVGALRLAKPGNTAAHRLARPENLNEREQRPAGHHRLALGMFDIGPGETSGIMLAPATVGLLPADHPRCGARAGRTVATDPGGAQRRDRDPGRVGEVDPPESRKGTIRALPSAQERAGACDGTVYLFAQPIRPMLTEPAERDDRRRRALDVGQ